MNRAFYSDSIADFLAREADEILGVLTRHSDFAVEQTQRDAWLEEIRILHSALSSCHGCVYFEYSIPRIGRRIDVVLLIGPAVFVLEFKVGEQDFALHALEQVVDYALDLKNFHETSHRCLIAPILIASSATNCQLVLEAIPHKDGLLLPIKTNGHASLADRSTRQLLKRLAHLDVLLVDELGYLNLKPEQSNAFFKLMEERYRRHSTIITTNLVYDEWPNFLGSRPMVEALLSRLRHYCHTLHLKGPSLREPQG